MVSNTGTYIDCPFHRYEHGNDLNDTPLEHFAELKGIVVRSALYQDTSQYRQRIFQGN